MNLRSIRTGVFAAAIALPLGGIANAQVSGSATATSATHVAAEMTKGKLNPAQSKPGDQVTLRLTEDLKSNGAVVLKKGTDINGVVKSVKRFEGSNEAKGQTHSMMEIEWLAPTAQGRLAKQLSIAVRSITQVNPMYDHGQNDVFANEGGLTGAASSPGAVPSLVGGVVATVTAPVTSAASIRSTGQSNVALLNMPSVVAADHQTSSAIESFLGSSTSGQLFKTGRGEIVTAGGSKQSVELFSHLNNDTVITSQQKNFEISSGAQMQLLIGVNRK